MLHARSETEKTLLASDLVGSLPPALDLLGRPDELRSSQTRSSRSWNPRTGGTLLDLRALPRGPRLPGRVPRAPSATPKSSTTGSANSRSSSGSPRDRSSPGSIPSSGRSSSGGGRRSASNRLDFRGMVDSGKVFLAKLAQGAIGEENAALLGSLLVSAFHQAAMSPAGSLARRAPALSPLLGRVPRHRDALDGRPPLGRQEVPAVLDRSRTRNSASSGEEQGSLLRGPRECRDPDRLSRGRRLTPGSGARLLLVCRRRPLNLGSARPLPGWSARIRLQPEDGVSSGSRARSSGRTSHQLLALDPGQVPGAAGELAEEDCSSSGSGTDSLRRTPRPEAPPLPSAASTPATQDSRRLLRNPRPSGAAAPSTSTSRTS